ncbi:MAG: LytTR family transcriptional regulator DNA-binding domain-containing protein [Zunongwangia sp.]|uniref:LytR/AlgR family response regulator transcription factor n=1 Tax=Zunongwangia sp. TaxID=1965325 RepID=UPI0032428B2E
MGGSYYIINSDDATSKNLCERFKEFPEFICLGITDDYENGMNFILKYSPKVVFIDVDSYPKDNIGDIFSYCKEINEYVFSRPKYIALSKDISKGYLALKSKFYDYILKPGNELEVRKVILQLLKSEQYCLNDTLCLKSYKDYTLLKVEEILFLKADNNTTDFVMIDGKTISAFKTLKAFERILPNSFIRIHHSYIINKKHMSRINFGKLKCFLDHNRISLPFSRSYRHNLQSIEELLEQRAISSQ